MKLSKLSRSKEWTMKDLEKALGDLKNNKSRDYEGYINEIFKKDVIGTNLKDSLLLMFNQLKKENLIPKFLNFANITTVHKKGSKLELKNQRGIFRVPVTRFIMMRLIYNSNYPEIDKNISDCQMGARKGKGCKTNIWIVNGINHDTLNNKNMKPVRLQITDYMQMFDSISLIEAINDIYDAGMKDDNLSLIYEANREIHMSVNTPGGLTERQTLKNLVLQGDTWGSILASVQVDSIGKNIEKAGLGYLYKGKLSVSLLGLVDDMIGISEAGYKSHQLNAIMNVRTAEKRLQFGVTKCKSMLVGKNQEQVINNALVVDGWEETYVDNHETGGTDLVDNYIGEVPISETQEQKYLGFVLSSSGNNMVNITAIRNKSIGIIRTIMNKLEKLHLKQYYFECALILMNTILRGSILYASETYYNLTENQLRNIERIEEGYLRKVLKTSKGCPIVQLYLSMGQWPARFEIQKYRLLFLKTILEQEEDSMVSKFFKLQMEHPTKGDWVSRVMKDLSELGFSESLEEIKTMSRFKFNKSIKNKIKENALEYLLSKRGSKGSETEYSVLEMSEYLLPYNDKLTISEKQGLFAVLNRMVDISDNYGKHGHCICNEKEDMSHIYSCLYLNEDHQILPYKKIYNGKLSEQIEIFSRFEKNMKKRNELKIKRNEENHLPCDRIDPLSFVKSSIG